MGEIEEGILRSTAPGRFFTAELAEIAEGLFFLFVFSAVSALSAVNPILLFFF
jgi:hypothetical protein